MIPVLGAFMIPGNPLISLFSNREDVSNLKGRIFRLPLDGDERVSATSYWKKA